MSLFGSINLIELFNNDTDYGKEYRFDVLTDDMIRRAEKTLGYKLPESYIELLNVQNGGLIDDKYDESWLTVIYGIGPTKDAMNGLEEMFENWKDEWEYPDIGIPFGETQSAGHDMYYMDYRSVDENGEPRIVRIDNECDNAIYFVADNLIEFVKMVYENQEIQESLIK
ncbi:MAG: SMI1/KNR4 family protein [Lachnospiraceae bacterium]|nr:SMI1/KNR4 family protein [Lachnospiraceae bacterium]